MYCLYDTQGEVACGGEEGRPDRLVATLRRSPHYRADLKDAGDDETKVDEVMHMRVPGGPPAPRVRADERKPLYSLSPLAALAPLPPLPSCTNAR